MIENIFTLQEVASILRKSIKETKYLLKIKRLQFFRVDGRVRVSEKNLNDFFGLVGKEPLRNQMMAN